jgi:hypothetical protein
MSHKCGMAPERPCPSPQQYLQGYLADYRLFVESQSGLPRISPPDQTVYMGIHAVSSLDWMETLPENPGIVVARMALILIQPDQLKSHTRFVQGRRKITGQGPRSDACYTYRYRHAHVPRPARSRSIPTVGKHDINCSDHFLML